jgi:hypothetical protein
VSSALALAHADGNGVQLSLYNNTAMAGSPVSTKVLSNLNFSYPSVLTPFSAEVVGLFQMEPNATYKFQCDFGTADVGFFFVDDHLVCQMGAYSTKGSINGVDNPLPCLSKTQVPIRLELYQLSSPAHPAASTVSVLVGKGATEKAPKVSKIQAVGHVAAGAYTKWSGWNIDTSGGRNLADKGGDMKNADESDCISKCESMESEGCIGFVRRASDPDTSKSVCYMRRLGSPTDTCTKAMSHVKGEKYTTFTRNASCGSMPPMPTPPPTPPPPPTPAPPGTPKPFDPKSLSPTLPAEEVERRSLQKKLAQGWATWMHHNVLSIVHLPSGAMVTTAVCQLSKKQCGTSTTIDKGPCAVRVGAHAYDR